MFKKKINLSHLSKSIHRKLFSGEFSLKNIKSKNYSLAWLFMIIFLFAAFAIFILFFTNIGSYLQIVVGYSIIGFFAFFMGYLGWILAQSAIDMIISRNKKAESGVIYYFRKLGKK